MTLNVNLPARIAQWLGTPATSEAPASSTRHMVSTRYNAKLRRIQPRHTPLQCGDWVTVRGGMAGRIISVTRDGADASFIVNVGSQQYPQTIARRRYEIEVAR